MDDFIVRLQQLRLCRLKDQQKEVRTRHTTFDRREHHLLETSELVTDFESPQIIEISEKDSNVTPVGKEVPQQLVPIPSGYVQVQNGYQPGQFGEIDVSNIIPHKRRQALFAGPAPDSSNSNFRVIRIDDVLPQSDGKWGKTYLCVSIIAIREELGALEAHNVFEVSSLPDGAIALGSRWVFTIKVDAAGKIIRFKARLVAQGFAQRPGIDFHESFAPVARMATIRFLIALAIALSLKLEQFDFDTAFLNGKMTDDVYMKAPKGWTGTLKPGQCLKLIASMYGTKQAPREWNRALDRLMVEKKWTKCSSDVCLYYKKVDSEFIIVAFYVDDGLVASTSQALIEKEIGDLQATFKLKQQGAVSHFLSLEVKRDAARELDSSPLLKDVHLYQSMVGALQYTAQMVRPDIAAAVRSAAQCLAGPTENDMLAVKRIFRYLVGTVDFGLCYRPDASTIITVYSDASWANEFANRRSVGAYVSLLGGAAISWQSKQQTLVAASTTESEILAASSATKEALWLRQVAKDMRIEQPSATVIYEDNQATIEIANNPAHHARTKHFDVVHHFVRERVTLGDVKLVYCPTDSMMADVLAKGLGPIKFAAHRKAMGMDTAVRVKEIIELSNSLEFSLITLNPTPED
ncbi:BQ5605_C003g02531 [Microbotryum silenes-dioicae]|uniref:BQ5605_C003g02531 protein n=1 Tax=Microbotryum silenes-dioicae TaxID=796604 RepID=A0A2X0P4W6_9BASI|nr:BQ5605_C003g02531 [Microbotryum silenes-dioicae]